MRYLFNLVYLLLIVVALPWFVWQALRHGKYRAGWGSRFLGRVPLEPAPHCSGTPSAMSPGAPWEESVEGAPRRATRRIWLHAVSVGEVNLLESIVRSLASELPDHECWISVTTRTGMELARRKFPGKRLFYCPLDFSWSVSQALDRVQPDLLVLAELEIWPNLIAEAHRRGVAVAVVNARLSERSFRGYLRCRRWLRSTFARLDLVAAQTEEYAERFRQLGALAERVIVTGNVKFDLASLDRRNPRTRALARLAGFADDDIVFLAGSTQPAEDAMALASFQSLQARHPRLKLVLVPRHPERFDDVARMLKSQPLAWNRRSRLTADQPADRSMRVLLVDSIGELRDWWGTADLAYVGGSMGHRGGQNMIEPAGYGAAIAFGPETQNFRDVVAMLLNRHAATVVRDGTDLIGWLKRCLAEPTFASAQGTAARELVAEQRGATRRTVQLLAELLSATSHASASHEKGADMSARHVMGDLDDIPSIEELPVIPDLPPGPGYTERAA
ncbi:MAG: 3-deoxy-D-manno-octulosonic acid transferase [Planctomycetes bacterium]|nr:3-deoxy-D-manno-octulosonic acid transferase [Planctomycetota bacterium]